MISRAASRTEVTYDFDTEDEMSSFIRRQQDRGWHLLEMWKLDEDWSDHFKYAARLRKNVVKEADGRWRGKGHA